MIRFYRDWVPMEPRHSKDAKQSLSGLGETLAALAENILPQRVPGTRQGRNGVVTKFKKVSRFLQDHRSFCSLPFAFCPLFPNSPFKLYPLTFNLLFFLPTLLPAQSRYEFIHPQMGTVFRLVFYSEKDSTSAAALANSIFARVDTLNAIFSDYQPESELNQLSDQAGNGTKVAVSEELWKILLLSKKYAKASKGGFDPTVGALTRLWRRARHLKEAPDSARIATALKTVDYRAIRFYKNRRVQLKIKGARLDLGGIAQGYAADECLARLRAAGISAALADAGGDIALGDAPPGTKGWTIERPTSNSTAETLILANCGITTSGGTYRYFEDTNGVRYSHIIDPRTGWGVTKSRLVTVLAPDAVTADAWATALSVDEKASGRSNLKIWETDNLKIW